MYNIIDVEAALNNIFINRLGIDMNEEAEDRREDKLLGKKWGYNTRELLYIYFDIKKIFEISIPVESIVEGKFNTYNNIFNIICNQLVKDNRLSKE